MESCRKSLLLVVALAAVVGLVAAGPCAAEWTVTDLGVLDGFAYSRGAAVNASGQVVGDSFNGSPGYYNDTTSSKAFVWKSITGLVPLPILEGFANSRAVDINASGQIVGTCWNTDYCCDCDSQACLWEYDTESETWQVTGLGYTEGHSGSYAQAINDAGQVLLRSIGAPEYKCGGTLWENGTLTDMKDDWGRFIWTESMNASGHATGQPCCSTGSDGLSHPRYALLWADGDATVLTPEVGYGDGTWINSQDEVVGWWDDDYGSAYGFLWLPVDAYDLTSGLHSSLQEGGYCCNVTSAINDAGLTLRVRAKYMNGRNRSELTIRDLATGEPVAAATIPRSQTFDYRYPGVMNGSGAAVGGCDDPDPQTPGIYAGYYLRADTGHAYLPSISGSLLDGYTWATDIDDAGHIVGWSSPSPSEGEVHAALWTGTAPANEVPVLDALTTPVSAVVGAPVTFTAAATDANLGDSNLLTYSLTGQPEGASIDAITGDFSWTPSTEGSATFDVVVSDGELADSQSVTVNVAANEDPVLDAISTPISTAVLSEVTFTATASDAEGETLTFGLTGAPAGATIDATTGAFSWTPGTAGSFTFSVTVSDANGSDSQSVTVNVSALAVSSATATRTNRGGVLVTVTIRNPASATVSNVSVTAATLGGIATSTRLPDAVAKSMRAGTTKTCKFQFTGVPAGSATFTLTGTSSAGGFSTTQTVTVP